MRVGIIGLGSIARKHLAALRDLVPGVEVVALRSRRDATPLEGVTDVYTRGELRAAAPDWILLSNPTIQRRRAIEDLLDLRLPLFIEKPALASLSGADELIERVSAAGIPTYVACNLRFLPCLRYVRKRLQKEDLRPNEVNAYCGSYLPGWRPGADYRRVYSARPELGGGAHLDLIHELDYLYWLFGRPEDVDRQLRSDSSLAIAAVDYAHYRLTYPNFTAAVTLNYFRRDYKRTLELVLPDATWTVDLAADSVHDHTGRELFRRGSSILDTYPEQMAYWLRYLHGEAPARNPFREGVEVLKICLPHA